ncbi:MAG: coproporphyrinogen III oxidase, partial [Cytophagales bacterium]
MDSHLIKKYNVTIPRYTSYPTLPFWEDSIEVNNWKSVFIKKFEYNNDQQGISLYIHLP